jgi:transcriptional regulator with PAS, ATPase and Fis domain
MASDRASLVALPELIADRRFNRPGNVRQLENVV